MRQIGSGNRRNERRRAGGDDQIGALIDGPVHFDPMGIERFRFTENGFHVGVLHQKLDSSAKGFNGILLMGHRALEVESDTLRLDADKRSVLCMIVRLCAVEETFGRDAPFVGTHSAVMLLLDQENLFSQCPGALSGYISARTAADNDQIILCHCCPSLSKDDRASRFDRSMRA